MQSVDTVWLSFLSTERESRSSEFKNWLPITLKVYFVVDEIETSITEVRVRRNEKLSFD